MRIETGRYEKLEEQERICIFCESGEVENERHFLCRCEAWKDEREVVMRRVRNLGVRMTDEEIMFMSGREEVKGRCGGKSEELEEDCFRRGDDDGKEEEKEVEGGDNGSGASE